MPETPDPLVTPDPFSTTKGGELDDALPHGIPEDILDEAFVEGSPATGRPTPT